MTTPVASPTTAPTPRKQNIACDACRTRKVKCNQAPGEDRCAHCIAKNYDCTHHAQQETEKKRNAAGGRRNLRTANASGSTSKDTAATGSAPAIPSVPHPHPYHYNPLATPTSRATYTYQKPSPSSYGYQPPQPSAGPTPAYDPALLGSAVSYGRPNASTPAYQGAQQPLSYTSPADFIPLVPSTAGLQQKYPYPGLPPPSTAPASELLAWLFSPDSASTPEYNGVGMETKHTRARLLDHGYRVEFANELIEVFFQVYHPRLPVINPTRFRTQFRNAFFPNQGVTLTTVASPSSTAPASHELSFSRASSSTSAPGAASSLPPKPLHRPLLAALLAWGSKFSDHPLLVHDRSTSSASGGDPSSSATAPETGKKSRISQLLVDRARELAEMEKCFRIPKPENVVLALLLEPMQPLMSSPPRDPNGLHCFWLDAAIRHLLEMQANRPLPGGVPSEVFIQRGGDVEEWSSMVFCWWIVCLVEAISCSYFRRKPFLTEDDYDVKDFLILTLPSGDDPSVSSKTQAESSQFASRSPTPVSPSSAAASTTADSTKKPASSPRQWYGSLHDLAICSRLIARNLWLPSSERVGVPFNVLESLSGALRTWREEHLSAVGVTSDLQNHGDYVSAVQACSTDCSYHVLWIILSDAVEEFGIKELNSAVRARAASSSSNISIHPHGGFVNGHSPTLDPNIPIPQELNYMVEFQRAIAKDALESSTRIAGLAGVLTSNGYMRLDPNAMHWPIYTAGRLLARLGKPEVSNCVDGLKQNGFAYEESWSHARELENIYAQVVAQQVQQQPQVLPSMHASIPPAVTVNGNTFAPGTGTTSDEGTNGVGGVAMNVDVPLDALVANSQGSVDMIS